MEKVSKEEYRVTMSLDRPRGKKSPLLVVVSVLAAGLLGVASLHRRDPHPLLPRQLQSLCIQRSMDCVQERLCIPNRTELDAAVAAYWREPPPTQAPTAEMDEPSIPAVTSKSLGGRGHQLYGPIEEWCFDPSITSLAGLFDGNKDITNENLSQWVSKKWDKCQSTTLLQFCNLSQTCTHSCFDYLTGFRMWMLLWTLALCFPLPPSMEA